MNRQESMPKLRWILQTIFNITAQQNFVMPLYASKRHHLWLTLLP